MEDRILRLLRLAQKTGDTLIVHDPDQSHDMVILSVEAYENLQNIKTTQKKTLKVNKDTSIPTSKSTETVSESEQTVESDEAYDISIDDVNAELALAKESSENEMFVQDIKPTNIVTDRSNFLAKNTTAEDDEQEIVPIPQVYEIVDTVSEQTDIDETHIVNKKPIRTSWHSAGNILENRFVRESIPVDQVQQFPAHIEDIDLSGGYDHDLDEDEPIFYEEPV